MPTPDDPHASPHLVPTYDLTALCSQVIAENPKQVEAYRAGNKGLLGFLAGRAMVISQGGLDPREVYIELQRQLG
jgi:Asp-tRNA(Asn)/Glu-tRNA(Gln) amidotransferase B subunit